MPGDDVQGAAEPAPDPDAPALEAEAFERTTFEVATRLREISELESLKGGARFQARAYARGASALEGLSQESFGRLLAERALTSVPAIGTALAREIEQIARTGTSRRLERLRAELPAVLLELTRIPGLGLARARALHGALRLGSLEELERACAEGRVRAVKGFGPATEARLLRGIAEVRGRPEHVILLHAREAARGVAAYLGGCPAARRVVIAGDVRRFRETTDELAFAVETRDPDAVLAHAASFPRIVGRDASAPAGELRASLAGGLRLRVVTADDARFGQALIDATGSAEHLSALRQRADRLGVELAHVPARDEADVYGALGLQLAPPEVREALHPIASDARMPTRLVTVEDVKGLVHCHTVYSDGRDTIEAMARRADELGFAYLTITDHSPSAFYAGGVEADRLRAQWDEIARVQESVRVKLLRGTESDILADGSLDYPDVILEQLDVVIASIHGRMKMDHDAMTERLLRMVRLPFFKIWGHPLGRLLLRRAPVACDVERILDAAAESPVAIEINGDPHRLDMEPRWIAAARERGLSFVASTDAHSTRSFACLEWAVAMARRGGLEPHHVLNTSPAREFCASVRPAR